jgi:hypothetical protein
MQALTGTNSTVGLDQAVVLASKSSGFRSDAGHFVILLTDGSNNCADAGHLFNQVLCNPPRNISTINNARLHDNPASLELCTQLKTKPNTLVFTIAFGGEVTNPSLSYIKQFLSDCATGAGTAAGTYPNLNKYFYIAPDAAALTKAFGNIEAEIKKVRIIL